MTSIEAKKVLFVCHSSSQTGGAEDEFERLLKYFSTLPNYEICAAFPQGERANDYSKYCKRFYLYQWGWFPVANEGIFSYIKYFLKGPLQSVQFYRIFKTQKFDLCVANVCVLLWPLIIARLLKVNSLVFIRETIMPDKLRKLYYSFLKKIGSFFIGVSDFNKKDFSEITGKNNVEVLYSAIEDNPVPDSDIKTLSKSIDNKAASALLKKENFKILHIGPISNRKNQMLTVETADHLINKIHDRDLRFFFIGDNYTDKQAVKKIMKFISVNNLENYCFFTGILSREDLFQLYLYSDAVMIPSLSEGLPLTLVDAFKFKKPVISANCGGMADIIQDSVNGFIVNDYNDKIFAEKIINLKTNNALYSKIVDNAYETYKTKFNLQNNMKRLNEIFHELSYSK